MTPSSETIGIDLGDRRLAAGVLSVAGDILAEEVITNSRECLLAWARRRRPATIVMETGTHSPWVSRLLESLGHTVHVDNARKVRAISSSPTKGDQEEARTPARPFPADRLLTAARP